MLEEIDPNKIQDEEARQVVIKVLNLLENAFEQIDKLRAENQQLRDENNRLKGEQGKPNVRSNKNTHFSSETERKSAKTAKRKKHSKHPNLEIHQEQLLKVKPENLPGDAVFKGYRYVVVRDLVFQPLNIRFKKERYYSPAQKRMIEAELPQGYQGQFGPTAKALVLTLYYEGLMSEPKIKELLGQAGLNISAGQLSHWLTDPGYQAQFHTESRQVLSAGLGSSKWQHIDTTASRVAGVNWHCHIICNPLYTYYCTLTNKDRLSAIRALRGGAGKEALIFRMDKNAEVVGSLMGLTKTLLDKLWKLPLDQDLSEQVVDEFLAKEFSQQPNYKWKWAKDALAIASYHAQVGEDLPILKMLICDDAPSFHVITEEIR